MISIYHFADQMIQTEDLDPVYCMLARADLPPDQLDRWLFAFLCFYHVGAASWLSEHADERYWVHMRVAAENVTPAPTGGRWPRASERRHFRGLKCVNAIEHFSRAPAPKWIHWLSANTTLKGVMETAAGWPMFGPWAGFKAADLLEVVKGANILFNDNMPCSIRSRAPVSICWRRRPGRRLNRCWPRSRRMSPNIGNQRRGGASAESWRRRRASVSGKAISPATTR